MVHRVASKMYERRIWRDVRPAERVDVSDCVARRVENVEATVAEVVECFEPSNGRIAVAEIDLHDFSSSKIAFEHVAIRIGRIAWKEGVFESFAHDQFGARRKSGRISGVIKVPVTPDDAFDIVQLHSTLRQDLTDILLHFQSV